jgi:hypothetical protein
MQNNQWVIIGDQLMTKIFIELKDDSSTVRKRYRSFLATWAPFCLIIN